MPLEGRIESHLELLLASGRKEADSRDQSDQENGKCNLLEVQVPSSASYC